MQHATRRALIGAAGLIAAGLLLAGCKPQAPAPKADAAKAAPAPAPAKVLVVGTDAAYAPFESQNDKGEIVGFDIDVVRAIAQKAGFEVKFVNTPWEGIFNTLAQGDRDLLVSAITITDERKQTIDFSDPYFDAHQLIAVPEKSKVAKFDDLKKLKVGVQTGTTGDEVVSKLLGKTSTNIKRFESTPLFVQILLVHFALMPTLIHPEHGLLLSGEAALEFRQQHGAFFSGALALTLNAGAYIAEIFRAGIVSIGSGQVEAAHALGLHYVHTLGLIVLPQATRRMMPAFVNEAITLTKDSSLVSAIGLAELALAARTVAGAYSRYWEPYLAISAVYLVLTLLLAQLAKRLEVPAHMKGR